ncbi:hypothetical protein MMC13_005440 [Lambiella insularis]|nr:hypothetical protein [Lambiella insularis]
MVHSAISFAATLGDVACAQRLTAVHQGLQRYIWAWELHKNLREGNLKLERREIARRRKELEERQERAVERMLTDAKEYRVTIESQLEESLRRILGRSEGDGLGSGDPGAQDDSNRAQEQREDKDDNQLPTDTRSPSLTLSLSHLPHQTLLEATTAKQNCRRLAWIAGTSEHGSNVQL